MNDCVRDRADSECDAVDIDREREADREPVPERERGLPRPRTRDVRDARGLALAERRPTLSLCSSSSMEPSASGTSMSGSSRGLSSDS